MRHIYYRPASAGRLSVPRKRIPSLALSPVKACSSEKFTGFASARTSGTAQSIGTPRDVNASPRWRASTSPRKFGNLPMDLTYVGEDTFSNSEPSVRSPRRNFGRTHPPGDVHTHRYGAMMLNDLEYEFDRYFSSLPTESVLVHARRARSAPRLRRSERSALRLSSSDLARSTSCAGDSLSCTARSDFARSPRSVGKCAAQPGVGSRGDARPQAGHASGRHTVQREAAVGSKSYVLAHDSTPASSSSIGRYDKVQSETASTRGKDRPYGTWCVGSTAASTGAEQARKTDADDAEQLKLRLREERDAVWRALQNDQREWSKTKSRVAAFDRWRTGTQSQLQSHSREQRSCQSASYLRKLSCSSSDDEGTRFEGVSYGRFRRDSVDSRTSGESESDTYVIGEPVTSHGERPRSSKGSRGFDSATETTGWPVCDNSPQSSTTGGWPNGTFSGTHFCSEEETTAASDRLSVKQSCRDKTEQRQRLNIWRRDGVRSKPHSDHPNADSQRGACGNGAQGATTKEASIAMATYFQEKASRDRQSKEMSALERAEAAEILVQILQKELRLSHNKLRETEQARDDAWAEVSRLQMDLMRLI